MTIVSETTIWSLNLESSIMLLEAPFYTPRGKIWYDHNMFLVQATGISWSVLFTFKKWEWSVFKSQKVKVT